MVLLRNQVSVRRLRIYSVRSAFQSNLNGALSRVSKALWGIEQYYVLTLAALG